MIICVFSVGLCDTLQNHSTDTNAALHYYRAENVKTENGVLNITTNFQDNSFIAIDKETDEKFIKTKHIQSGMVQGWNKFCFTGGILEISAKLPGKPDVGGLWPACEYTLSLPIFHLNT